MEVDKIKPKAFSTNDYSELVRDISSLYADATLSAKTSVNCIRATAYWKIGKRIVTIEQESSPRAQYGTHLLENLSRDLSKLHGDGFSYRNLVYMRRFYIAFPILQAPAELGWTHYQALCLIEDSSARKHYEERAIKNNWTTRELKNTLRSNKVNTVHIAPLKKPIDPNAPVPKLYFKRGELGTYTAPKTVKLTPKKDMMFVDFGFNIIRELKDSQKLFEMINKKPQYTYKAYVERIIDGDTLWSQIDCGFGTLTRQKLRFKGIDCPEIKTLKGQRAKQFVENTLGKCKFIIVQTHKSDKYDRYLADIFFLEGEVDSNVVAKEGKLLNQVLLDEKLAQLF